MTRVPTSRRADTGLPDVMNGARADDCTYYDDGFTTDDLAGSVLAGRDPLEEGPSKLSPRGRARARLALGE